MPSIPDAVPPSAPPPRPSLRLIGYEGIAFLALAVAAAIGVRVRQPAPMLLDRAVRDFMLAHQNAGCRQFLLIVSMLGAPNPMILLAVAGCLFVWWRRDSLEALAVLVSPAGALALYELGKRLYARPRPAGAFEGGYAFPSAHATASAAVFCTLAYVLWQERFIPGPLALAVSVGLPALIGLSRLYLNVHWASDVIGGWAAGLGVAALSIALFGRARREQVLA